MVSFRTKLLASHAAVALATCAVALLVVERAITPGMEAQIDHRLEAQAHAVATWVETARHHDRLAPRLAGVVGARVTIFDPRGTIIGESSEEPAGPGQSSSDPPATASAPHSEAAAEEVRLARDGQAGHIGRSTRYSPSERQPVRYLAVLTQDDMVVRLGLPLGEIEDTKAAVLRQLGFGAIVSLLVAASLAALLASALSRRLRAASILASRIGAGDYHVPATADSPDEVGVLVRTLVSSAAELEATEARRHEFLANVAHELRTPVTSIRGFAETLAASEVDGETQREFLQTIHRNSVRISTLVDDLLELEALSAGKAPAPAREIVDLGAVVQHVLVTVQRQIDDASARVEVALPAGLKAHGDSDAVERIVLNLVDNALRYGGAGVAITVSGESRGDRVELTVRDDGPGISAEHKARLFERFFRGAMGRDRDHGGSGLGLAIARELAQSMGGTLSVDSAPGKGAAFMLELAA